MREYKFKVWDIKESEWVDMGLSCLTYTGDYWKVVTPYKTLLDGDFILCQYTGLKDKNGVEIYEGDVMSFIEVDEDRCLGHEEFVIGTIEYIVESGGFRFVEPSGSRRELYLVIGFSPVYDVKIIGNIYENPELLEALDE